MFRLVNKMDINSLLELRVNILYDCIDLDHASSILFDENNTKKRSWHKKEWKNRRSLILKDSCEQCGSSEKLTLQHTFHPRAFSYFKNEYSLKDSLIYLIDDYIRYQSLFDTITYCKKCAFNYDVNRCDLCPVCKVGYKQFKFPTCFKCKQG